MPYLAFFSVLWWPGSTFPPLPSIVDMVRHLKRQSNPTGLLLPSAMVVALLQKQTPNYDGFSSTTNVSSEGTLQNAANENTTKLTPIYKSKKGFNKETSLLQTWGLALGHSKLSTILHSSLSIANQLVSWLLHHSVIGSMVYWVSGPLHLVPIGHTTSNTKLSLVTF